MSDAEEKKRQEAAIKAALAAETDGASSLSTDPRFLGLVAGGPQTPLPSGPNPTISTGPSGSVDNPLPAKGPGAVVEVVAPMPTRKESMSTYNSMLDDINRRQLIAVRPFARKLSAALVGFGLGSSGAVKASSKAPGYTVGAFLVSSSLAALAADDVKDDVTKIVAPFVAERAALNILFSEVLKDN